MQENVWVQILWVACVATAIVTSRPGRSDWFPPGPMAVRPWVTVYSVLMLPTLVLLLRAERRGATVPTTPAAVSAVSRVEGTTQKR
jgi:hypothetical protein